MGIPDPASERFLITRARQHAADLLASFSAAICSDEQVEALCARAAAVFDNYGDGLLEALRAAIVPTDNVEKKWLREHYLPLLVEFATALRDTITDAASRHAAAQAIQCKVLDHERHLRLVLEMQSTPPVLAVVSDGSVVPAKSS
jgi:hypothetical protein